MSSIVFWIHWTKSGVLWSVKAAHFKSNIMSHFRSNSHTHTHTFFPFPYQILSSGISNLGACFQRLSVLPMAHALCSVTLPLFPSTGGLLFLLQLNPVGLCVLIWPTRSDGAWLTELGLKGPHSFCFCLLGCQVPSQEVRVRRLTDVKSYGREIRSSANNQHQGPKHVSEAILDLTVLIKPMMVIICACAIQYGNH